MGKKILLIVNPMAGKNQARTALYDIVSTLCDDCNHVTVMMTTKHGDATDYAMKYCGDYDIVSCVGGDGTLSEVVCGLMQVKNPPPIGYIPLGSTNDVATTLKIPRNPAQAARDMLEGKPITIDIGSFNDTFFTYVAAFGAFTDVPYTTPQESKNALGPLAYFIEGVTRLPHISNAHAVVTHDGGTVEGDFIYGSISNSTSVAGFVKLTEQNVGLDDGLFEVLLIKHPDRLTEFNQILSDIITQKYLHDAVIFFKTTKIKFEFSEPVAWTRDGEDGGYNTVVEAYNNNHALSIIVRQ